MMRLSYISNLTASNAKSLRRIFNGGPNHIYQACH